MIIIVIYKGMFEYRLFIVIGFCLCFIRSVDFFILFYKDFLVYLGGYFVIV